MRLETARLILRPWEDRDRPDLARILGDAEVRRFYPSPLDRAGSDALIDRTTDILSTRGFSLLCAELKQTGRCVGTIGLLPLSDALRAALPVAAEVEIGWQLDSAVWGQGLAPEGAASCLDHAFRTFGLPRVVAFTYEGNRPSRRVMEKLGMRAAGAFLHPNLPEGHRLRPHVAYGAEAPLPG